MMLSFGQPLGGICQIAYLVPDIQAAMRHYSDALGVGPWLFLEHWRSEIQKYRGEPTDLDMSVALGFSGSMMVELIEQHDDTPSVYKEVLDARGYGFHHFGVSTRDFDADCARYVARGYEVAFEAVTPKWLGNARVNYLDSRTDLSGMIELCEMTPEFEAATLAIKQPSEHWDGTDLFIKP